jgi:hypothetical protein
MGDENPPPTGRANESSVHRLDTTVGFRFRSTRHRGSVRATAANRPRAWPALGAASRAWQPVESSFHFRVDRGSASQEFGIENQLPFVRRVSLFIDMLDGGSVRRWFFILGGNGAV